MRRILGRDDRFAGVGFSSAGNQAQNLPGSVILSPCFEFRASRFEFYLEGLLGRCASKHRNRRRESAGWGRWTAKRCQLWVSWARRDASSAFPSAISNIQFEIQRSVARRLRNPEGGRKLDDGYKRVSEGNLQYHAHKPRAPRQGCGNVPLSAQPGKIPENCNSGDLQWSAVVSRNHFLRFFANMRSFLGLHLIILIQ
jgi:hypothetical protein